MSEPFVSACCIGERCFCGANAEHKVEETVFADDPIPDRHPLTTYLCHAHFREIMGPAADRRSTWFAWRAEGLPIPVATKKDCGDAQMRFLEEIIRRAMFDGED